MNAWAIRTPTPDIARSIDFYRKAGFERIDDASNGDRAAFSDGAAVIEIDASRTARTAIVLYTDDAKKLAKTLEAHGPIIEREDGFVLTDPTGAFVWLVPGKPTYKSTPASRPAARLGTFAGMSVEAADPTRTMKFWSALGYEKQAGDPEQGWVQLGRDGAVSVSVMGMFMCPHLFFNPGLTYFNSGKNPEIIAGMREAGVPITEEITVFNDKGEVDNVIVRDPGGTGFFVFND